MAGGCSMFIFFSKISTISGCKNSLALIPLPGFSGIYLDTIAVFYVNSLNTQKILAMPFLPTLKVVPGQILGKRREN
jgi:hypothetical protein